MALDIDKYSSNLDFILVTSVCNLSLITFSSFNNCSCFNKKKLVVFFSTLSNAVFISLISISILPFKSETFFAFVLNSFIYSFIDKFSFFKDSSSSIGITLCPL